MFELIVFILFIYGVSNILVYANGPFMIFEKYRQFMLKMPSNIGEGSGCMICTPTQVGIIYSLINSLYIQNYVLTPSSLLFFGFDNWFIMAVIDGAVASGGAWLIHTVQECLESITNKNNGE